MSKLFSVLQKKTQPTECAAVIVAAGSARRMEGIDKILTNLGELPVLAHTLYAFQDCDLFDEIIVVTREDLLVPISQLCKEFCFDKVHKVVVGGAERIHSVRAGVKEVSPEKTLIAIHDGARPFVTEKILSDTVRTARRTGAAAPALPITDTIKRVERGVTQETIDRTALYAVQTPQVFEASLIRVALEKAIEDGETLTDDCAAVERMGMHVSLTQGSRENIKITTPFDLLLGTTILEARVRNGG